MSARLWLAALVAVLVAGCGAPGEDAPEPDRGEGTEAKIDVSKAGPVTLTVWDQEVRGGQRRQIETLNAQFQAKYPNVTIKRVAKSITDLNTTLKLAVSSDRAPDVVQANQGRQVMGTLVKGGLLRTARRLRRRVRLGRPLRARAARPQPLLQPTARRSATATSTASRRWARSSACSTTATRSRSRRARSPSSKQQLAAAKQRGEVPISFGNLDKWPGIHEFQAVQNEFAPADQVRDFVFARDGASFATPENEEAAAKLQEWAEAGYFTKNFNGVGYDPAYKQFADGAGPFLIAGTWLLRDLTDLMGDRLGFMLVPPAETGGDPQSLGGESLPFAITAKSEHPEVAAAYIDFLTDANAADVLVRTGNLPAMPAEAQPRGAAGQDVFEAWRTLTDADGLVPYLDYATPTFYDTITAGVQQLMAGRESPSEFTEALQGDFEKFTG